MKYRYKDKYRYSCGENARKRELDPCLSPVPTSLAKPLLSPIAKQRFTHSGEKSNK